MTEKERGGGTEERERGRGEGQGERERERWESSGFCRISGFLVVPEVILDICLYLLRKIVCVYLHYNRELLTPCAPAAITASILYQISLS